MILVISNSL